MDSGHWKMRTCSVCGSCGIHMNCNKIFLRRKFTCKDCEQMLSEINKQKIGEPSSGYEEPPVIAIEDSQSDIPESHERHEIIEISDSPLNDFTQRRILRSRTKSFYLERAMASIQDDFNKTADTERTPENNCPKRTLRQRTKSVLTPGSSTSTATLNSICSDGQMPETSFGSETAGASESSRKKYISESEAYAEGPKLTLRKRSRSLYVKTPSDIDNDIPPKLVISDKEDVKEEKTPPPKRKKSGKFKDVMMRDIYAEPRRRSRRLADQDALFVSKKRPEIVLMCPHIPFLMNRNRPTRKAAIDSRLTTIRMTKYFNSDH